MAVDNDHARSELNHGHLQWLWRGRAPTDSDRLTSDLGGLSSDSAAAHPSRQPIRVSSPSESAAYPSWRSTPRHPGPVRRGPVGRGPRAGHRRLPVIGVTTLSRLFSVRFAGGLSAGGHVLAIEGVTTHP